MVNEDKYSYVSLFSSAGIDCAGLKKLSFDCICTSELIERRLQIQKYNNVCSNPDAYVLGDIKEKSVREKINQLIDNYLKEDIENKIDLLIATPPCQGISLANHKKGNEVPRNSLVVESISITKAFEPEFFIFENVLRFLDTLCVMDDKPMKIKEAIFSSLGDSYRISTKVLNLKNYGSLSSRTRTLVIGTRKGASINPLNLFPDHHKEIPLSRVIKHLPSLKEFNEFDNEDFLHHFRPYPENMRSWISNLKEGQSAFDNTDPNNIPHQVIDGRRVENKNKNADKYKRNIYDKVAPAIHTRNDILSSQNTVHPKDDRVFSIRELMLMMTVPDDFNWFEKSSNEINELSDEEKLKLIKEQDTNIRQCLGEAIPTNVITKIVEKYIDESKAVNSCYDHLLFDLLESIELPRISVIWTCDEFDESAIRFAQSFENVYKKKKIICKSHSLDFSYEKEIYPSRTNEHVSDPYSFADIIIWNNQHSHHEHIKKHSSYYLEINKELNKGKLYKNKIHIKDDQLGLFE